MSAGTRLAPPPRAIDTSAAEQGRAHKLWNGRAGHEASEDQVIETILSIEAPNLRDEQRGAERSTAKAALHWLMWCRVLTQVEPGIYRWADEFPEWPSRTHAEVQARDAELRQQEFDAAQERERQEQAAQRARTDPNRPLEQRIAAVESALDDLRLEIRASARHRDGEQTIARLDELAAQKAAREGREPSPPDTPGEETRTDEHQAAQP